MMNDFLAQFYGTVSPIEEEKTAADAAQVEMFAKLAQENGIDISSLSDEKLEELFQKTFTKEAGEMPPQFAKKDEKEEKKPEEKKDEKEEKEKNAQLQKQADEADFMGRIMAHAYVNEMRKIAAAVETNDKTASIRDRLLKLAAKEEPKEEKKEEKKDEKEGKPMPPWMKDKEASALNELAVQQAVGIVQEYNKTAAAAGQQIFDVKVAAERLSAVHTLGLSTSEKVASAETAEQAAFIRSLEYLEAAGYPVSWGA